MVDPALRLDGSRLEEAVDVFCDAFSAYPVMRFVALGDLRSELDASAHARMRRLTRLFVTRRFMRGGPLFGVFDGGQLVGAAILTLPDEPAPPAALVHLEQDAWNDLGEAARARYDTYAGTTRAFAIATRHHHLNMIGVRAGYAGRGFARPLLDSVRRLAAADPDSEGISLTTELPQNVRLYEHFGYEVIGHARVSPDLETWGLFLKTSARQP